MFHREAFVVAIHGIRADRKGEALRWRRHQLPFANPPHPSFEGPHRPGAIRCFSLLVELRRVVPNILSFDVLVADMKKSLVSKQTHRSYSVSFVDRSLYCIGNLTVIWWKGGKINVRLPRQKRSL